MPRIYLCPCLRPQVHRKGELLPQCVPRRHSTLALINRPARSLTTARHRRTFSAAQPLLVPSRRMGVRETRSTTEEEPVFCNRPIRSTPSARQPEQQRPQDPSTTTKRTDPAAAVPGAEFPSPDSESASRIPISVATLTNGTEYWWPDARGAEIRTREP